MFIVVYMTADGKIKAEHIKAKSAQAAADAVRAANDGATVREVSKVVKNWI